VPVAVASKACSVRQVSEDFPLTLAGIGRRWAQDAADARCQARAIYLSYNDYSHSRPLPARSVLPDVVGGGCLGASGMTYKHTRAARHTALSRCRSQPVGEPPTDRLLARSLAIAGLARINSLLARRSFRVLSLARSFALLPPHDGSGKNGSRSRQTFPVRREERKSERRSSGKRVKTRHNSQA
jgi:hypothetical protein